MPSNGAAGTAIFKYQVPLSTVRKECEAVFGLELPPMRIPKALSEATFSSKLKTVGGVVFTNGGVDEWAGGEHHNRLYLQCCWLLGSGEDLLGSG